MRYLPLTPEDRSEMLARIGVVGIDDLFADIPGDKRLAKLPDLPLTKSEIEVERELGRLAATYKNVSMWQLASAATKASSGSTASATE